MTKAELLEPEPTSYDNSSVDSELTPDARPTPDSDETNQGVSSPGEGLIMKAIAEMKVELHKKIDGILTSVRVIENGIKVCEDRLDLAEIRISGAEDDVNVLKVQPQKLETSIKELTERTEMAESRSRLSNLRIINLPEKAEGEDACAFLETWLPEALGLAMGPLHSPLTIERTHHISGPIRTGTNTPPRTLIVKFLKYRDKGHEGDQGKRHKVLYKNQDIRFYPDLSPGLHKQQKCFDGVRQQLRDMGIQYGMLFPACVLVTH